jgi:hypothetical protein
MNTTFFRQWSLLVTGIILLLSCAHQMSPTGGPDDRTGPTVVSAAPSAGAVNVDPTSRCSITFSEWISKTAAPKSVSVLPSLDGGVKISVSGRRLEITPKKKFADSTTYHIVITTALQDLHTNPLAAAYTLVFSTGPALDSGKVIGCVVDQSKRTFQPTVALFRARGDDGDSVLFTDPDYLTQADSAAYFSLENVHRGSYRVIAFIDQNGNHRLDPGVETAYAAVRPTITVTPQPDTLILFPAESDTTAPHLESAKPIAPKTIIGALSRPIDTMHGYSEPLWTVECLDTTLKKPAIVERRWFGRRSRCALVLADTLSLAPYRVTCTFSRRNGSAAVTISDTARCNGTTLRDTLPPILQSCQPAGIAPLLPEITLSFTKPVTLKRPLFLTDTLRDTVRLSADSGYSDTVILKVPRRLLPGGRYRLVILQADAVDMAGNTLKPRDTASDTAGIYRFSVIAADSLAVSLKGCVACLPPEAKRKWRFIPVSGSRPTVCPDSSGCFSFDSIPYGKGIIGYFIDENGNNRPDPGSLVPWRAPEPSFVFPDTVEARARWEVEGVSFVKPCVQCEKAKPSAAAQPGTAEKKRNQKQGKKEKGLKL